MEFRRFLVGTCYALTASRKQSDVMEGHRREDAVCVLQGTHNSSRGSGTGSCLCDFCGPVRKCMCPFGPQFQKPERTGFDFDRKVPPVSRVTAVTPSVTPRSLSRLGLAEVRVRREGRRGPGPARADGSRALWPLPPAHSAGPLAGVKSCVRGWPCSPCASKASSQRLAVCRVYRRSLCMSSSPRLGRCETACNPTKECQSP